MKKSPDFNPYALGRHLIADFYDCDAAILADAENLEKIFLEAAKASGATVLQSVFRKFNPQGVSGFMIIAESHMSVHTWPEHDYAAVDIFTCGDTIKMEKAIDCLKEKLSSGKTVISADMKRGILAEGVAQGIDKTGSLTLLSWKKKFDKYQSSGISILLDISDVPADSAGTEEALAKSVKAILAHAGTDINQMKTCKPGPGRNAKIRLAMENESFRIFAASNPQAKTVHLDIFSVNYLEPRLLAESIISILGAEYYRINVSIRRAP